MAKFVKSSPIGMGLAPSTILAADGITPNYGTLRGKIWLGQPVLKAIANQYFTLGIFNGLAIVGIAIIFDRISQAYGKRLQKHQEIAHG